MAETGKLEGAALEDALAHDAARRVFEEKMRDLAPGDAALMRGALEESSRSALGRSIATREPVLTIPVPPPEVTTMKLPDGVRTAMWMPVATGADTFYVCTLDGFGHVGQGTSRSKAKALAYALEDLSRAVLQAAGREG